MLTIFLQQPDGGDSEDYGGFNFYSTNHGLWDRSSSNRFRFICQHSVGTSPRTSGVITTLSWTLRGYHWCRGLII